MKNIGKMAAVGAILAALAACSPQAPAPSDTAADEAALHAAPAAWAEAYNAGDVDRLVAMYTEDAVLMPPNAPAASSHAAMHDYLQADSASAKDGGLTLAINDNGVGVSGNLAWQSGTWSMTDANGVTADAGKWLSVWRKANGKWLMIRDTWNSDQPAAATAEPAAPAE